MFEILAVERMGVAFNDVDAFASSVNAATLHYECSRGSGILDPCSALAVSGIQRSTARRETGCTYWSFSRDTCTILTSMNVSVEVVWTA